MKILGIDTGEKRIGIAVSDALGIIASPLKVIGVKTEEDALAQIIETIESIKPSEIVIGLPRRTDGKIGEAEEKAKIWAEKIKSKTSIPIRMWDERFTTKEAERMLIARNVRREDRKQLIDKVTAAIILQSYLDSRPARKQE